MEDNMKDARNGRVDLRLIEPQDEQCSADRESDRADPRTGDSIFAWLAGLSAAIFIIAIVYGVTNRSTQTAFDRNAPRPAITSSTGEATPTTGSGGTSGDVETTGASTGGPAPSAPQHGGQ
jgi:hypothetical protein